mgnify:CR=1 FL=1
MTNFGISEDNVHALALYKNHMEFNGYRVEEWDDEVIACRHSRKHNLIIRKVDDRGVLLTTVYALEPNPARIKLLEYVNDLNHVFCF